MGPFGHEVLIDWIDASRGEPAADVCRSYVLLRPAPQKWPPRTLTPIRRSARKAVPKSLNWLPFVAAARLAEGVPEIDDLMKMVDG
jgi:hypothetical protein